MQLTTPTLYIGGFKFGGLLPSRQSAKLNSPPIFPVYLQRKTVPQVVELTEADTPGASLDKPLEAHNVVALKWWLLHVYRGIKLHSTAVA